MTQAQQASNGFSLNITRTFDASPERVFDAWVTEAAMLRWFAPNDDYGVKVVELDPRPGGRYRVEMHDPDGSVYTVFGEYLVVDRPGQLVMTWSWEHENDDPMLVTVTLRAAGDATELHLLHEKLPSETSRDLHDEGWNECLDRLPKGIG